MKQQLLSLLFSAFGTITATAIGVANTANLTEIREQQIPQTSLVQAVPKTQAASLKNNEIVKGKGTLIIRTRDEQARHSLFFAQYGVYDLNDKLIEQGTIEPNGIETDSLIAKPISLNLAFGTYIIKEIKAPNNDYQISEPMRITFAENNQEITFLSKVKNNASLNINISDESSLQPISSGQYLVVNWKNDTILPPTQPQNGEITLSDLPYGWYVVREVKTPEGYIPDKYHNHQILLDHANPDNVVTFSNMKENSSQKNSTQSVDLEFVTSDGAFGTTSLKMKGVRVGEYLWTNEHLKSNNLKTLSDRFEINKNLEKITKEQVDYAHKNMAMFNFHRRPDEPNLLQRPTYWAYGITTDDVNEHYGAVFNQAYFTEWYDPSGGEGPGKHKLSDLTLRASVQHADINFRTVSVQMKEGEGKKVNNQWRLPLAEDLRQLVGMCGKGSIKEIRQHLSWGFDDPNAPIITKATNSINTWGTPSYMVSNYFEWFDHSVNDPKTNKFGFNLVPAGWRQHAGTGTPPPTSHYDGLTYPYTVPEGGFIILNQVFRLRGSDGSCLELSDQTNLIHNHIDFAQYPIRFCRPLTDEELGYKLWINIPIEEEEDFMRDLAHNFINPEDVKIEKRSLTRNSRGMWYELPRGYIRGAYVQYILDNPKPEVTLQDILELGYITHARQSGNNGISQGLWKDGFIITSKPDITAEKVVNIYPTVVSDFINIDKPDMIDALYIFDTTGKSLSELKNIGATVDLSHFAKGVYILKLQSQNKVFTHKVIKL